MSNLVALDEFFDEIREVDYLLSSEVVETSLPGLQKRGNETKRNSALCRASLVMLVAHFEGFVKAALAEFVEEVRLARPPARRVPGALLELLTRERIREISSTDDQSDRISKTRKLFTVYGKLWDEDRSIDTNLLSEKVLVRQFPNATMESIENVLSILDVENTVEKIQEHVRGGSSANETSATDDVVKRLKSIVDTRNRIAHGSRDVAPNAREVQSDLGYMSEVAVAIDQLISERVKYCCALR